MSLSPDPLPDHIEGAPPPLTTPEVVNTAPPHVEIPPPPPKRFPAWSGWDLLAVIVFTIVAIFVFTVIALFVARSLPQYRHATIAQLATNALIVIGAQAAAYPAVLLFIFFIVSSRSDEPYGRALRWNWPGGIAPAYVAGGAVLALVVDSLARFLPIPKSLPMDTYFHSATDAYAMAIFGITLAPLFEETLFRGLLYPLLDRAFGVIAGVLLTAAAFAAIHGAQLGFAWAPVFSIFIVGIVFTVVRVRTNSVASSFLLHCGYNFALFAALWVSSDHFRHLEKAVGS